MGKGKPRRDIIKVQNCFRGEGKCPNYDKKLNICHSEYAYSQGGVNEYVTWAKKDISGKLECKGNRHVCYKLKLKWLASLSERQKQKYLEQRYR